MALTFDMSNVVESKITEDNTTHYVMCMATIHVGMPVITAENADEFFIRVSILETVHGALRQTSTGPLPLTLADVRAFIGLRTNATPYTQAKFNGHIARTLRSHASQEFIKQRGARG